MKTFLKKLYRFTTPICVSILLLACHKDLKPPVKSVISSQITTAASRKPFSNPVSGNSISFNSQYFSLFKNYNDEHISHFYERNQFKTKWLHENAPNVLYYTLTDLCRNAGSYGLNPEDYDFSTIDHRINLAYISHPVSKTDLIDLDMQISKIFLLFTSHISNGKISKTGHGRNVWKRIPQAYQLRDIPLLADIKNPVQLKEAIEKLEPQHEQYRKLKKALEFYRNLEDSVKDFPAVYASDRIEPYYVHPAIPAIRKRISITDPQVVVTDSIDSLYYDENLVAAVKRFQNNHGLEADGIIGEKTIKFLNQSFGQKADQIALNMDRLRWMPANYGDRYILVNVPEFQLRVYNEGKKDLEMKVIVGAPDNATPIFNEDLEHIVFSPTWTVPPRILKEEVIPQLIKDPAYYAEKNYLFYKNETEIDPLAEQWNSDINPWQYKVVQLPGPNNSLGLVKFIMPNNMNVYLHDTPSRRLFKRSYRALSHGCIRLEKPGLLAEYLLHDQGWDEEDVVKAMQATDPSTVLLKKHYKVFIEYRTAWVDDNGAINFREDIYKHDQHQLKQLLPAEKRPSVLARL